MKKNLLLGTVGFLALSLGAFAQEAPSEAIDLGDIDVVDTLETDNAPAKAYESFDPIDTGTSTISAKSIEAENQGDVDTTELIRKLPNVQLSVSAKQANAQDLQNIRPQDFVISGGNFYNNNIMVDGVQANAVGDVTNTSPANLSDVAGQTAQTLYVDPSLVGEIIVRDSNVSAEYGDFTGGVVELNTRQPSKEFGVTASVSYQDDSMVNYKLSKTGEGEDQADRDEKPVFEIRRYAVSADLPVTDKFGLLLAYSQADSTAGYRFTENYGGQPYDKSDISRNFMVKGLYEFSDITSLEGQVTVSPYSGHYGVSNKINHDILTKSDGFSSYLKLVTEIEGWDVEGQLSYTKSDASRETEEQYNYSWSSSAASIDWCSGQSSCSYGGFGDIDQTQDDLVLSAKAERELWQGLFRFGGEIKKTEATKSRPNDSAAYLSSKLVTSLDCAEDDTACIDDEIYLARRYDYLAYDAEVELMNEALWAEYERDVADFTFRGGLRYSHDDFLDNHNLAPRLTASWQFRPDWFLTVGANRYYAKNMVAYAIKSQYPDSYQYERETVTNPDGSVTLTDFVLYRHTRTIDYAQGDLNTPYSDELTAALTIPTPFNGNFRLKAVHRDGKDDFASSPSETVSFDAPTATSSTSRVYTVTNGGGSEYNSLSAEWSGTYKNHALSTSVTWSETHRYGGLVDYFDRIDEEALDDLLLYQGNLITERELYDIRNAEDFASPLLASAIWSSNWFDSRLNTTVGVYYRGDYETITDTGVNEYVDSVRYDVYDKVTIEPFTSVNLNADIKVFENAVGRGALDIRVENLFDDLPHSTEFSSSDSYSWEIGRSIWLGFNFTY